jgi:hypothetical protein
VGDGVGAESAGSGSVKVVGVEVDILEVGGIVDDAVYSLSTMIALMIVGIIAASKATTAGTTIAGFRHNGVFDELNIPHVYTTQVCRSLQCRCDLWKAC